jgi:SRSO17 transposase
MRSILPDWEVELARWLKPFLEQLGHKARRRMCPLYVVGLIGPGDRKSVQPMAERLAPGDYDQLHHFVAAGVWDAAPLEKELLVQADKLVGGSDAVLVIDDTAVPKKGKHSVGVAWQYASALGKNANCQTLVSLTLARDEVPVMVALRLFLPESWTSDLARLKRAGVAVEYRTARTKPEIALAEIDRVTAAGVRFGCVLADAGYGLSAPFRQGLTARNLAWAVGIPRHLKVYPVDVRLLWPVARRGRPRRRHVPDILSMPAEDMLAGAKWQTVSWRPGTKASSKPALPLSASAPPMGHRSGSGIRASNICPAMKPGLSANTAAQAKRNTISPICLQRPVCVPWRPPSRHDGFASKPISS